MDPDEFDLRIRVSRMRGWEAACQHHRDYGNELSASLAAAGSIRLDAYPCGHCKGWHIGAKITDEERFG